MMMNLNPDSAAKIFSFFPRDPKPGTRNPPSLYCSCCFLLILLLPLNLPSTTITVSLDGSSSFTIVQDAINFAQDGDSILVSPGTYSGAINFSGKNLILSSLDPLDPQVVAATVLRPSASTTVVTFSGTEGTTCILSGLTITNGSTNIDEHGGGINGNGTLATIEYCRIIDNCGFGAYLGNPPPAATYFGAKGAGIGNCDGLIQYCTIVLNDCDGPGGGLYGCDGTIQYNTINENVAGILPLPNLLLNTNDGGAMFACNALIRNNVIRFNFAFGRSVLFDCNGEISYNEISSNNGGLEACNGDILHNRIFEQIGSALFHCNGTIAYNEITSNTSSFGAGLFGCQGLIENNYIAFNTASERGGGLMELELLLII